MGMNAPPLEEIKHGDHCFSEGHDIPFFCAQNHGVIPETSCCT